VAATVLVCAIALGKVNQWVLPRLYDYLHAALCAASFVAFATALWLLLHARFERLDAGKATATGAAMLLGAASLLPFTVLQLDQNQNVRVALMHPNVPTARTLMLALGPTVLEPMQRERTAQARALAKRARATRTARVAVVHGPVLEDAHVLLITVDALRPDHLSHNGYARPTSPNLDRLAAHSLVFERAYAQAPHSSYSLCSLMTSEYLHETLDLGLPAPEATLATVFSQAGYHTAAFYTGGIFHTEAERLANYERSAFGFALHDRVAHRAPALTDRLLAEVDRTLSRGEPSTFLWAHYFDVHEPYLSTHFGTRDVDRYDSEIRNVDREIARLVREVRARLSRPVIVAISADHGEEFREHGGVSAAVASAGTSSFSVFSA
jgi:glucan phosphoethanolaminetransferase (alkaline phosphatase superfamily)